MKLKYVGPKPIISHTGIQFDNNKDDKYSYLNIAIQLINALDHPYIENRVYNYDIDSKRLSEREMEDEIKKICPNIESLLEKQNHNIEGEIEHNIQRAHENKILSEADKVALQNNIRIMHDYMIQRSINKNVYYCAINALADILKRDHIDYLITPMFQNFNHVFHSIQGALSVLKNPIETEIQIYMQDGKLYTKLVIKNS
ncbi:hypothetical protein [Sulfurimonas sp.]|uniref:hypothetical protein n=1 Tax=Sulfurimonas sp. TaxID=2022749 RepID=UPI0025DC86B9|nr:hypothetical protein [Sulfurimonas sp.]MDD5157084.1 hypothetical protein [Sulfurimonas sp.]